MTIGVKVCRIKRMDNLSKPLDVKNSTKSPPKFKFSSQDFLSLFKNIFASTQNIIGLDIGYSYIKIVQLQKARKGYVITNCITRAIPRAVKDSPTQKKKLIREFVKEFIADARIKTRLGRLAISGKGIFILSLNVPYLSKKDLKGAVSIELKKRLPFQIDLNNVFFDFFAIDRIRDEKGVSLQVTCIAAERFVLDEQVEFLKEMGIRPVAINVISDAIGNLLPFCLEVEPEKSIAVLDLGANASLLNFYRESSLHFSREIPVGGEHFTKSMTKTVTTATGTAVNIIFEEAEKIKRQCGIPLEDEANAEYLTDFGILLGSQIYAMLRPTLERLITEISRTFNYYTKTFKTDNIEELYITGGSSRLRNIDKFLLYNVEGLKKVESLNTLKAVRGWADTSVLKQELVMEQAAPYLACAFGLCLGNGGKVNLLPVKEKIEQEAIFLMNTLRISFPIILALSLSFYGFNYAGALKYKILINKTQADISRLESTTAKIREYLDIKNKLDRRKDLLEKAAGRQPIWWGVLKELSNITTSGVILQKITAVETKEPKEIRLVGKIFAKYTIVDLALSQYLMVLDESSYFSRV